MARVFITGSADGLGHAAAETLLTAGHEVLVHVRAPERRAAVEPLLDRGATLVVGDLADLAETRSVAEQVNALGAPTAVIHNAGVYSGPSILSVNVIAPYVLTALLPRPERLVYVSSGMHRGGTPSLDALDGRGGSISYSDSKLFVTALAAAVARRWPEVRTHAVDPGWVPTKMGGPSAPDDLRLGHLTQEWLATSDDDEALTTGGYWFHQTRRDPHPAVNDTAFQARLLDALARATGISLP
ncbi:MAG: SDR family NAD(P)-dependent oxidoreductase [Polyangiaceae bacterium]